MVLVGFGIGIQDGFLSYPTEKDAQTQREGLPRAGAIFESCEVQFFINFRNLRSNFDAFAGQ